MNPEDRGQPMMLYLLYAAFGGIYLTRPLTLHLGQGGFGVPGIVGEVQHNNL